MDGGISKFGGKAWEMSVGKRRGGDDSRQERDWFVDD